ncbi:MAG: porin family protein, partial [Rhodomicrobium sp.]
MMKMTLAAATVAALVGVAGAANAADLYKGSTKDVPVYVPPPTWTGFYIGAHVGGAWADIKNRDINDYTLNG